MYVTVCWRKWYAGSMPDSTKPVNSIKTPLGAPHAPDALSPALTPARTSSVAPAASTRVTALVPPLAPGLRCGNLELLGPVQRGKYDGSGQFIDTSRYLARCLGPGCGWTGEVYRQYIRLGTRKGRCCGREECDPSPKPLGRPKSSLRRRRYVCGELPGGMKIGRLTVKQREEGTGSVRLYLAECGCGWQEVYREDELLAVGSGACDNCPG